MLHAVSLLTGVVDYKSRNACRIAAYVPIWLHPFWDSVSFESEVAMTKRASVALLFAVRDAGVVPGCAGGGAESGTNGTERLSLRSSGSRSRRQRWWRALFAEGVGFVFCSRQIRVDRKREFERIDGPRASDRLGFDSSRKADGSRLHCFGPSDRLGFDWSRSGEPIVPSCRTPDDRCRWWVGDEHHRAGRRGWNSEWGPGPGSDRGLHGCRTWSDPILRTDRPALGPGRIGSVCDDQGVGTHLLHVRLGRGHTAVRVFRHIHGDHHRHPPVASKGEFVPDSDDFYVQEPDRQIYGNGDQTGVLGGNGFWAELDNDLGNAPDLLPGQSATGTVTIDVPSLHGLIVYNGSDDGQVDGTWSY